MIEYTRTKGKNKGTFKAYTEDEAKELGIKYKYWKELEPTDVGEYWALSDDGYIGEVLNVQYYGNKNNESRKNVKLLYGTSWVNNKNKIEILKNIKTRCFSQQNPLSYNDRVGRERKAKRFAKLVAQMRVNGNWPLTNEQLTMLGTVYNPREAMPLVKAKYLLKNKGVQQLVNEEITKILLTKGLDKAWTIEKAKAIVEGAIETNQFKDADKALEKFERWNKMVESKVEQTQTIEAQAIQQIGDILSGQKLKLEQKTKGELHEGNIIPDRTTEEVEGRFGSSSATTERSADEE